MIKPSNSRDKNNELYIEHLNEYLEDEPRLEEIDIPQINVK